jgi:hypothetical protein
MRPYRQHVYSGGAGRLANRSFHGTRSFRQSNNFKGRDGRLGTNQRGQRGRNHVFARHDGNWHRGWDRRHRHFWNNRWWVFNGGYWLGLDSKFYPQGYYPYDYYPYDNDSYAEVDPNYYTSADPYSKSTVSAVQSQLARQGYYGGATDGVYGPQTRAALVRYQSSHRLEATGSLTASTLQSLGVAQATGS